MIPTLERVLKKENTDTRIAPDDTLFAAINKLSTYRADDGTPDISVESARVLMSLADVSPTLYEKQPTHSGLSILKEADRMALYGDFAGQLYKLCGEDIITTAAVIRGCGDLGFVHYLDVHQALLTENRHNWIDAERIKRLVIKFEPGFGQPSPPISAAYNIRQSPDSPRHG